MASIYVASPLGFSESGRVYYQNRLLPMLDEAGFAVLDPWAEGGRIFSAIPESKRSDPAALSDANNQVGATNVAAIDAADAILAVLDGADVDSGTAAEVGYASAIGRPVVGLRTDLRTSGDNVAAVVNLQVEHFIKRSGGCIVGSDSAALAALERLLRH